MKQKTRLLFLRILPAALALCLTTGVLEAAAPGAGAPTGPSGGAAAPTGLSGGAAAPTGLLHGTGGPAPLLEGAGAAAPADPPESITIRSAGDLLELSKSCALDVWSRDKKVRLAADISLEGVDFAPIPSFGGEFDGCGHTVSGLRVEGNASPAGLFGTVQESGVVKNLNLIGNVAPSGDGTFLGGVAGINRGRLENCSFEGVVQGKDTVGGIVGRNDASGRVLRCTFKGVLTGEHYVGGVAGQNAGSLIQCANQGSVNTTEIDVALSLSGLTLDRLNSTENVPAGTDIGGVAGFSGGLIRDCQNDGDVGYEHMGYNVGGIAGRQSGYLDGCVNRGTVRGRKDVGGIAGQMEPRLTLQYGGSLGQELDTLRELVDKALSDAEGSSDAVHTALTGLSDSLREVKDAASALSDGMTDWGNDTVSQVNEASSRLSFVISELEPILDGAASALERAGDASGLLSDAADGARAAGRITGEAADEIQSGLAQLQKAAEKAGDAVDKMRQAVEHMSGALAEDGELGDAVGELSEGMRELSAALSEAGEALRRIASALPEGDREALEEALTAMENALDTASEAAERIGGALTAIGESDAAGESFDLLSQGGELLAQSITHLEEAFRRFSDGAKTLEKAGEPLSGGAKDLTRALSAMEEALELLGRAAGRAGDVTAVLADKEELRFSPIDGELTRLGDTLSETAGRMLDSAQALNGAMSGASDALLPDLRAVNNQLSVVADALWEDDGEDRFQDVSSPEADPSSGRISGCRNEGDVEGDINVAGVAGSLSVEYDFDPEDDLTEAGSRSADVRLQASAVVLASSNYGAVTAKKNYAGGIAGRMDLGLLSGCGSYGPVSSTGGDYVGGAAGYSGAAIQDCFVKCALSGGSYVGGVTGAGDEDSQVARCRAMVEITGAAQYTGAVSGSGTGEFLENRFVSDSLAGLGPVSYAGRAEPVTYEEMAESLGLPPEMTRFTLRFVCDGETVREESFSYGDSFSEDVFPALPEKDGFYVDWDTDSLADLRFDKTVTAVYTRYVLALPSGERRENGRPVFLVEGNFPVDGGDELTAVSLPAQVPEGIWETSLLTHRSAAELWRVVLPEDGFSGHTLRYLPPKEGKRLSVYVKDGDGRWEKALCQSFGSSLTFRVEGREAEIAVLSDFPLWWIWAVPLIGLVIFGAVLLARRLRRPEAAGASKAASKGAPVGASKAASVGASKAASEGGSVETSKAASGALAPEASDSEGAGAPAKRAGKKRRWVLPVSVGAGAVLIAGVCGALLLSRGADVYRLLSEMSEDPALSLAAQVETRLGSRDLSASASLQRVQVGERTVTCVTQEGIPFYFVEDTVLLENGRAYQTGGLLTDYSALLSEAASLYRETGITASRIDGETVYTIAAQGEAARRILSLLLPSDVLSDAYTVQAEVCTDGETVAFLRFSSEGALGGTAYTVSATLRPVSGGEAPALPEAVRERIASGNLSGGEALSGDLMRLLSAWASLYGGSGFSARIALSADCGPLGVAETLHYARIQESGGEIHALRKGERALYFSERGICDSQGAGVSAPESGFAESAKLLDAVYQLCLNGAYSCVETGTDRYLYTLALSGEEMEQAAFAIAPGARELSPVLARGSVQLFVEGGELQSFRIDCAGELPSGTPVSLSGVVTLTGQELPEIPEAVRERLLASGE